MRKLRDFLCGLAFLLLTAVSLWAAAIVSQQEFPDAASLESLDVRQWLIERDMTQESQAMRSRLARRLEDQLRDGSIIVLAGELRSLDEHERQRLEKNLSAVLEITFRDKVTRYTAQPVDRRQEWLDREIAQLERGFGKSRGGQESLLGRPGTLYAMGLLGSHMERWIERADPSTQERMREFQRAVQKTVVARMRSGD